MLTYNKNFLKNKSILITGGTGTLEEILSILLIIKSALRKL